MSSRIVRMGIAGNSCVQSGVEIPVYTPVCGCGWTFKGCQMMSAESSPYFRAALWTTRGPIHLPVFSGQGGKILLHIREKSLQDFFFFFFWFRIFLTALLTHSLPTVDIGENSGDGQRSRVFQTRRQPLGIMSVPSGCSIDGSWRKWSSGDILKENLWMADISMTGSAWQHTKINTNNPNLNTLIREGGWLYQTLGRERPEATCAGLVLTHLRSVRPTAIRRFLSFFLFFLQSFLSPEIIFQGTVCQSKKNTFESTLDPAMLSLQKWRHCVLLSPFYKLSLFLNLWK